MHDLTLKGTRSTTTAASGQALPLASGEDGASSGECWSVAW